MEITNRENFMEAVDNLLDEIYQRLYSKNSDYAGVEDPFANFKAAAHFADFLLPDGIPERNLVLHGIFTRMGDKKGRLHQILVSNKEPEVKDESAIDTLLDWAGYLLVAVVYLQSLEPVPANVEVEDVEAVFEEIKDEPADAAQAARDWFNQIFGRRAPVTNASSKA